MKQALLFGLGSLLLAMPSGAQNLLRVKVDSPSARELAEELQQSGFDVIEGSVGASSLELVVSEPWFSQLVSMGYSPEVVEVGRPFRQKEAEWLSQWADSGSTEAPPAGYPDLASIEAQMQAAAAAFPSICQFVDLTTTYGAPETFEGRHLYAVKISDNAAVDEDEPAAMVVSTHHARELITPVIALYAIEQLTSQYGSNPTITQLVDDNEIWIAPVWNPDGYAYVFDVQNLWRKNRRVFGGGVGVDLNRNYPFRWNAPCGGSTAVSSETYRGPSAGSEAETMTMMAWSEAERFAKVIDYHSFGPDVLYAYNCTSYPLSAFLAAQAQILAQMSGYSNIRPPSAEGEHYEWQLATYSNYSFLIETGTAFQPSYASAQNEAVRVFPGILYTLGRQISVSGHVTDLQTGLPLEASISYLGVSFPNGETNTSDPDTGRYHAFLPNGPQTLTFSAPGYISQKVGVFVNNNVPQVADASLVPVGFCPTASVTTRTFPGNLGGYTATLPIVGQQVTFTVNTQGFQFGRIYGFADPKMRPLDAGFVLVEPESPRLFVIGPFPGPVVQGSMVVAPDISLCGTRIYTQCKLDNGPGPFRVTNSQDLLIGL